MPVPKKSSEGKARSKAPVKAPAQPFIRIYHSESLHERTVTILATLEDAEDRTQYRGQLADMIVELTSAGMNYCFLRPLRLAKVGYLVEQSANLGMAGTMRILGSVVHSMIGRMDDDQLLTVCSYMRQLMQ